MHVDNIIILRDTMKGEGLLVTYLCILVYDRHLRVRGQIQQFHEHVLHFTPHSCAVNLHVTMRPSPVRHTST